MGQRPGAVLVDQVDCEAVGIEVNQGKGGNWCRPGLGYNLVSECTGRKIWVSFSLKDRWCWSVRSDRWQDKNAMNRLTVMIKPLDRAWEPMLDLARVRKQAYEDEMVNGCSRSRISARAYLFFND